MPTQRTLHLFALTNFIMACFISFLGVSTALAHPTPRPSAPAPLAQLPTLQTTGLITVSPISFTLTEPQGSGLFTLTLSQIPTASVTVNLTLSNTQCLLSRNAITLTPQNWNVGVTTLVTATNDQIPDGDQPCLIQTAPATSTDPAFNNLNPSDITVMVKDDGQGASLQVTPITMSFRLQKGQNPDPFAQQYVSITNGGNGTLNWNASKEATWLQIIRLFGSFADLAVSLNSSAATLATGSYSSTITIDGGLALHSPFKLVVYLEIFEPKPPALQITPTTFTFSGTVGAANPPEQLLQIKNGGEGNLTWNGLSNSPWLRLNPLSGTAPSSPTVAVDLTGLAVGSYTGIITVTSPEAPNSPQLITVSLTVVPTALRLGVSPTALTFQGQVGAPNPPAQLITMSNLGTGNLTWDATETITWLNLSQTSGNAPATTEASVNLTGLAAGSYTETLTITAAQAADSPQTVTVTLRLAPPPQLELSQQVSAHSLPQPSLLVYTLTVTNSGQTEVTGVELVDVLPAETVLISATQGITLSSHEVSWPNLTLGAGATVSYTLHISATPQATLLTNTVLVSWYGAIYDQSQQVTVISHNQSSGVITANTETILPIPQTPHQIRFPATPVTTAQYLQIVTLANPTHPVNLSQIKPPDGTTLDTVTKSGLAFHLTAQGLITATFIATPAQVEITPYLQGTPQDDILFSFTGADTLSGQAGHDVLYGSSGNDTLQGEDGNDTLYGEEGQDTLLGGNNNDILYGGDESDLLQGGNGQDILFGEGGDDTLFGRQGNDTLLGGEGSDLFGLTLGEGADIIVTFIDGQDKLGLPAGVTFAELIITPEGSHTRIMRGPETLATLQGLSATLLDHTDFTLNITPPARRATTPALTAWYLYYWQDSQQLWREASTTCDTPAAYTRTDPKISIPICRPGEFTWLRLTTQPDAGLIQAVYLPLVVK